MKKEFEKLDRETRVTGGKVEIEKVDDMAEKWGVSNDFLKALNKGMDKYDDALRKLVER